jgi:hypothetical protein
MTKKQPMIESELEGRYLLVWCALLLGSAHFCLRPEVSQEQRDRVSRDIDAFKKKLGRSMNRADRIKRARAKR